jgi:hypothetical protein
LGLRKRRCVWEVEKARDGEREGGKEGEREGTWYRA